MKIKHSFDSWGISNSLKMIPLCWLCGSEIFTDACSEQILIHTYLLPCSIATISYFMLWNIMVFDLNLYLLGYNN